MISLAVSIAILGAVTTAIVLAVAWARLELKEKAGPKLEPPRAWGDLPVVKITGDERDRHVESRRIVIDGERRIETRLYVDGSVVESRRFGHASEAVHFHDTLVKRNGIEPGIGSRPEWSTAPTQLPPPPITPHEEDLFP